MRHDLPQEGDSYGNVEGWYGNIADKCGEVGEPTDCLPLSIDFFESADSGRGRSIPDPGPGYQDLYDYCDVENVQPSTDPPTTVPSGTRITVDVVCGPPLDPDPGTTPGQPDQQQQQEEEQQQQEQEQQEQEQQEQQQEGGVAGGASGG